MSQPDGGDFATEVADLRACRQSRRRFVGGRRAEVGWECVGWNEVSRWNGGPALLVDGYFDPHWGTAERGARARRLRCDKSHLRRVRCTRLRRCEYVERWPTVRIELRAACRQLGPGVVRRDPNQAGQSPVFAAAAGRAVGRGWPAFRVEFGCRSSAVERLGCGNRRCPLRGSRGNLSRRRFQSYVGILRRHRAVVGVAPRCPGIDTANENERRDSNDDPTCDSDDGPSVGGCNHRDCVVSERLVVSHLRQLRNLQ